MDLSDPESIRQAIATAEPDLLINPAAFTAVDLAESMPAEAMAVNGEAVGIIAEQMRARGGFVIHFSTDYIYNPPHSYPITEEEEKRPQGQYARSKLEGEKQLQSSGVDSLCIRTSWVYGSQGKNFVKTMLQLGRQRTSLKVVNDQWGSPTSTETLAGFVRRILVAREDDPISYLKSVKGVYNLADAGYTNWHKFAAEIFALAAGVDSRLIIDSLQAIGSEGYPTPAARPSNSRLDLTKLREVFGFEPPYWQDSLKSFIKKIYAEANS